MKELMLKNRALLMNHGREFQERFGVPLKSFHDLVTGFDVVAFDKFLKTPDGKSTQDYLATKHGPEAVKLIETLLEIEREKK